MGGHKGRSLLDHLVHLFVALGFLEVEEDQGNLRQDLSRIFVSSDRVVEGRSIRIGEDGVKLLFLLFDSGSDGWNII